MDKDDLKKDAREYGNALNEAGWAFMEAYYDVMNEALPPKLFNNAKTIIRAAIVAYIEALEIEEET